MTTFYGSDENSNLRIKLFESSLENARKLWVKVVVFDGGSNHPDFERIVLQYSDVLDIRRWKFHGLGDQTRKMLEYSHTHYRNKYIFRTEPEKYWLLTEIYLWKIIQKALENPDIHYISPTRILETSKLPKPLAIAEASVWRQVNALLRTKDEESFQEIHDGSKSEWSGSLFWPILITQLWIDAILSSEDTAWGTWFFPRIVAAMEGKSLYVPLGYNYDEQEIKKENTDMRKLWKFCTSKWITGEVKNKLKIGDVQEAIKSIQLCPWGEEVDLENNLAFKRLQQYVAMFNGLSGNIKSRWKS